MVSLLERFIIFSRTLIRESSPRNEESFDLEFVLSCNENSFCFLLVLYIVRKIVFCGATTRRCKKEELDKKQEKFNDACFFVLLISSPIVIH